MSARFNRIRFVEYFSDPFYIVEIIAILSATAIMYSSIIGIREPEVSISDGLNIIQILLILYSSVISYYYSQRIERGIIGYIFTNPINRYSFLGTTFLFENIIPAILIVVNIWIVLELVYFSLMLYYIAFTFLLTIADLLLMTSIGRLFGTIIRSGILTFVFLFGLFYSLYYVSSYLSRGSLLWLIGNGVESLGFVKPSTYLTELLLAIIIISYFIFQASLLILKRINLKSGR